MHFHIHSALSFGDFLQLQKFMWGIEIVQSLAINPLSPIDHSLRQQNLLMIPQTQGKNVPQY